MKKKILNRAKTQIGEMVHNNERRNREKTDKEKRQ